MKKEPKTNAMRLLEKAKVNYTVHSYPHVEKEAVDGVHVAQYLNEPCSAVFKTLVTRANTKELIVYMIPVDQEMDLKKCAKAAHVKNVEMIHVKELQGLTGYIRGGCSPVGMKKSYRTFINQSCENEEKIYFSAGRIGLQVCVDQNEFLQAFPIEKADLVHKDH